MTVFYIRYNSYKKAEVLTEVVHQQISSLNRRDAEAQTH